MAPTTLRAAILVISDTAYHDASTDKACQVLTSVFNEQGAGKWSVTNIEIVPDKQDVIASKVKAWCADDLNVVVTTGGTGFATKDVTPEAIEPLLEKKAPGLVHGMLAKSLEVTPFAVMSRPVAGVRNGTIIVTLPGSPKGAKENLEAIIKLLPHACLQAAGMDSRMLHAGGVERLENEAGVASSRQNLDHSYRSQNHAHEHGHAIPRAHTLPQDRPQSNDPAAGPSHRHRESPYPMVSVQDAITTILENTPSLIQYDAPVNSSLIGHVLAEHVQALEAVPAFRASIVDGYAIIVGEGAQSSKGIFPVVSVSHAAPGSIPALKVGQIARITTGAPLPDDATSVVMVEDTNLISMTPDGKEEQYVEVLTGDIKSGENVREVGSDIEKGSLTLRKGDKIGPGALGLLASVGVSKIQVFRKPCVGVLSTGDEIIQHDHSAALRLGEVRDCNRPAILAVLETAGYRTIDCGIAGDSLGALEVSLRHTLRECDVVITTGGVSMGELDLLKPAIERFLGGKIHFGRVSMKPGKPTTFATVQIKDNKGDPSTKLIFSLPGNPASAITCTSLFVLPCLSKATGTNLNSHNDPCAWKKFGCPRVFVILAESIKCDKTREEYQRATVLSKEDGRLHATVTGGQRSSRVGSFLNANALLVVPANGGTLEIGSQVEALLLGPIQ